MNHDPTQATLTGVLILATAVWLGGLVTIFIVARVASRTLPPASRVAFVRGLGRVHGLLGTLALAAALSSGGTLLRNRPWDGLMVAIVTISAGLVCLTVVGMVQARRMTRLRCALMRAPANFRLGEQVRRGARRAAALRVAIGVCSLALVALAVMLST